jgi:transposase
MSKVKKLQFSGETIYCGLDVHKKNWQISPRLGDIEIKGFSQNPDAAQLWSYCKKHYPGAHVKVVYEAGFCGFGIQRSLSELGIECIVVNAADVPSSDKERKRKDDKRDARKLGRELCEGHLKGIYIPAIEMEQARTLVRERYRLVQHQTRCKNQIRHILMFSGIKLNMENERWSEKYVKGIEKTECQTDALKTTLQLAIVQYRQTHSLIKQATQAIQKLAGEPRYFEVQQYLQSIDGIGLINGMVIQTEIQDINRFKTLDQLCDYAGFVPDISSSDDKTKVLGVTQRCNEYLREAIIESSWILIAKDPAMLMKYNEYRRRMGKNKAIIRIGKHLLARIRHVWKNQEKYERGIVGPDGQGVFKGICSGI